MLPDYDPSNVDLSPDEHLGVEPMYRAIQLAQVRLSDGADLGDIRAIPEIALESAKTVGFIVRGNPGDPSDDDAIADRIAAVAFGMLRASQVLKAKAKGRPE